MNAARTRIVLLSLAGYGSFCLSRRRIDWASPYFQQALILGCILLVTFAGLLSWLRILFVIAYAITGRLMYPAHLAVAMLIMMVRSPCSAAACTPVW